MPDNNKFPIVLAHGIARFDILREIALNRLRLPEAALGDRFHYFKGIKSHLEANGFEVHHSSVDFAGSVDLRAQQLSKQINQILNGRASTKVHVITHRHGRLGCTTHDSRHRWYG